VARVKLGLGSGCLFGSIGFVRSNHLNALFLKVLILRIAIKPLIPDQTLWTYLSKTGLKSWHNKGDFMRRSTLTSRFLEPGNYKEDRAQGSVFFYSGISLPYGETTS
jgi:hypothetical protein